MMKRKMNAKSVFAMIGGIFLLIGLVFSVTGSMILVNNISFMKRAEITEARITNIEADYHYRKGRKRTEHNVWVEYTVDGRIYNEKLDVYNSNMYVGMRTEVYYDPDNPSDVRSGSHLFEIIFMGLGGIFLIVGGVLLVVYFSSVRKKKMLMQNGEALTGKIIDVRVNTSVRINNRNPYKADCEVINPYDGQRYLYSSENITEDITGYIGSDVTIYIDRDDPKKHYIDMDELINRNTSENNDIHDYRN